VEYIYIIMITWRHFGKPEIVTEVHDTGKAEGDCNLIPAPPPWPKTAGAVLGVGHQRKMTPHPLHQQKVITTVNCQSL